MKIVISNRLPFVSATLTHQGQSLTLDNMLLDTGSASTLLSADAVAAIDILPQSADPIHRIRGVGGTEFVFEKTIDQLSVAPLTIRNFKTEIGMLDYGFDLDGILGLDFLLTSRTIIDLGRLECTIGPSDAGSPSTCE